MRIGVVLALASSLIVGGAGRARADEPTRSAADEARAGKLIEQGSARLGADRTSDAAWRDACPLFEQARELYPLSTAALLNLGDCAVHDKLFATAVRYYRQSLDVAKEKNDKASAQIAEEELAKNEPLVAHLAITFQEAPGPDAKLVVDNRVVAIADASDVAVDPGDREVVLGAPKRIPFRGHVALAQSARESLAIPRLAKSITVTSSKRRIGMIATAVGVAALGTGVGIGLYARNKYNAQFDSGACSHSHTEGTGANAIIVEQDVCDADALKEVNRAHTLGNVGTIVGIAGLVVLGAGVTLWIIGPSSSHPTERSVSLVPSVSPTSAGLTAVGRF